MSHTRPARVLTAAVLAGALGGALVGCGGSSADPGTGALGSTSTPAPTSTAATPTTTPSRSRTARPTTPASTPAATEGDGDAEGDNAPATKGGGICRYVGAAEVGAVLGVGMTGSAIPGGGCKFAQAGRYGMSVTVLDKSTAEAGGMSGARNETTSAVEGEPQDLSGIGSAAFVVTGTMFGGTEIQGAGAVRLGGRIVSVYLVQGTAIPATRVRALEIALLKLVVKESPNG